MPSKWKWTKTNNYEPIEKAKARYWARHSIFTKPFCLHRSRRHLDFGDCDTVNKNMHGALRCLSYRLYGNNSSLSKFAVAFWNTMG
jgi:hypothetical protein